jgi:hypothetical protein
MGTPGPKLPPASQAVNEALDVVGANEKALRHWTNAIADGVLTDAEIAEGIALQERALKEAREVPPIAEKACQLVTIGANFSLYGTVSDRAIANAATIGIEPPTLQIAAYD